MNTRATVFVLIIIVFIALASLIVMHNSQKPPAVVEQPIATVLYACSGGKTITAAYYKGAATPAASPNQPPTPGGSVALTFSDGSTMTLAQTISADGARYANTNESFVFWSKGNGALVLENGQENNYTGCIAAAPLPEGSDLTQVYATSTDGFSIRTPNGYTIDESYAYQELGPGKDIPGVKFTIPASVATGTNLGTDSYISVEVIPQKPNCTAALFLDHQLAKHISTTTDQGIDYSFASTTGAGAGNRYEETVYALPGTNPCTAVRYFIHYGVIDNYPPGMVQQFDETSLKAQFDAIRRSLILAR